MEDNKESINDRVKIVRKTLKMTQQVFAIKLGIHGGSLSVIESGRTDVTKQNIYLICTPGRLKEGKTVNEDWLRTGAGDMFLSPSSPDGRPKLYDENSNEYPPDVQELVGIYEQLTPPNKKVARKQVSALLESQEENQDNQQWADTESVKKERAS
jgi:transcriptional regulator with XRE-family HTH domain